ncbi:MAG: glycoside hydrolase family 78 protein [Phycisphaeraceae bacterium]
MSKNSEQRLAAPGHLRCECGESPLGIDQTQPRLSWQVSDGRRDARQSAYQIVAGNGWDTGQVRSDQSVHVPYRGPRLRSGRHVSWKVRTWDAAGQASPWSELAWWEMGLLSPRDWRAQWIAGPKGVPCPLLRRALRIPRPVTRARVYVTARGLFEIYLNGQRIGRDELLPGWTDFSKRLQYLTYDVTGLLRVGDNALGAMLADGWYCGYLGWKGQREHYGKEPSLLLQLAIDGQIICTDATWCAAAGPILEADLYNGETFDAQGEIPGWTEPGFVDARWSPARVMAGTKAKLVAKRCPPVRCVGELRPVAMTQPQPGVYIFDLGQNMVGRVRLKMRAPAGARIQLRHGEMLQADGTLYTENLRSARATDVYICKGDGQEEYEPRFTFHGFRYIELTGCPQRPDLATVTGIVLHTDLPLTGQFECSDPLINRLQQTILWGQKGNFLEVPTDCPQRDERLGWTGDAQVFAATAAFNMDVSSFFEKWADDMADAQRRDGAFPHVAPDILYGQGEMQAVGSAAWADAGVICPWTMYLHYADARILEQNYGPMCRWIAYQKRSSRGLIRPNAGFGDWLAVDAADPGVAPTPKDLIGTAYFAYTTRIMAQVARILGKKDDARRFTALAKKITTVFQREYLTPGGRLVGDTQTGYLLALAFDLLPPGKRAHAVTLLVKNIEWHRNHLRTGFVGTPLLAPVLSRFGRTDVSYRLLLQQTYPSWLYPILQGATTMWERWNSFTRDRGFGPVDMNSFNHYAYGAIGQWLYATVAGIRLDPAQPGYKHIIIRPEPPGAGGDLTWAKGQLISPYGRIASAWQLKRRDFTLDLTIPPNTRATVTLPGRPAREVGAGSYHFSVPYR